MLELRYTTIGQVCLRRRLRKPSFLETVLVAMLFVLGLFVFRRWGSEDSGSIPFLGVLYDRFPPMQERAPSVHKWREDTVVSGRENM